MVQCQKLAHFRRMTYWVEINETPNFSEQDSIVFS
jgi:hypothetical protein